MLNKTNILVIVLLFTIGCVKVPDDMINPSDKPTDSVSTKTSKECSSVAQSIVGQRITDYNEGWHGTILETRLTGKLGESANRLTCDTYAKTSRGGYWLEVTLLVFEDGSRVVEFREIPCDWSRDQKYCINITSRD